MKSFLARLKGFLFSLALIFCFSFASSLKDYWENRDIRKAIDTELDKMETGLKEQGISPQDQSLYIIPKKRTFSDKDINKLLAKSYGKSGTFIYGSAPYTISAQAIDKSHYLVHSFLEGYQPFKVSNVMMPLYVLSQRKSYMLDSKQYAGRPEVWQSSRQAFLYPRGDCEDHAIALADWLIEMNEDARVVLGKVEGGGGHAWVVLYKDGKEYLLEATQKTGVSRNKAYPLAKLFPNYQPSFMFNRNYFWVNKGSKVTTRYSGKEWVKMSRYSSKKG